MSKYYKAELFNMGRLTATQGALGLMEREDRPVNLYVYLARHLAGDWGDMSVEDKAENEFSIDRHLRLFSAYDLPGDDRLWIITEADRSATTLLLPADY